MSVFSDDWRACLRSQYIDVVQQDDQVTLKSLVEVMHDVGFGEAELRDLYLQATMRADDLPADFMPDHSYVVPDVPVEAEYEPEPELLPVEVAAAIDPAPLDEDDPAPDEAAEADDPPPAPPDFQQLTLF